MKMNKINKSQLNEYLSIFGKRKMQGLLRDYLADSTKSWEGLDKSSTSEKRRIFHCWRSNSLVFGMEDFSRLCTKIEDDLINNRFAKASELIPVSKECYQESILKVIAILQDAKK